MKKLTMIVSALTASAIAVLSGADSGDGMKTALGAEIQSRSRHVDTYPVALASSWSVPGDATSGSGAGAVAVGQSSYDINRSCVSSGGAIGATSTNYTVGHTAGPTVVGQASSSLYELDIGFWYGYPCEPLVPGDINLSGTVTSADIIYLVNYVFKSGPDPLPCVDAGNVNCAGSITSADVIYLVNFVFKGGPAPCASSCSPC